MPDIEVAGLHNLATVWVADGTSGAYGQFKRAAKSIEVFCRWDDSRRQMRDPLGNLITVDASVVFARSTPVGSTVFRGSQAELADLMAVPKSANVVPTPDLVTLYEVVALDETEDAKGRAVQRTAGLARLSATAPESV